MPIITTARKPNPEMEQTAINISKKYNLPYVSRGSQTLGFLIQQFDTVLLLSRERLSCHTWAGELFLHPNMAALRIKLLRQGKEDKMIRAMDLQAGDSFLDCTAGLCADSLVARYGVGHGGRVVALEKSLPVYIVAQYGLEHYSGPERFAELAAGIEIFFADFRHYLAALPAKSFDIVYFDPMYDDPVLKSSSLLPLRPLACPDPLTKSDIALARRVARRRVVVKQRSFYDFSQLGLSRGTGYNRKVAYGFLDIKENDDV